MSGNGIVAIYENDSYIVRGRVGSNDSKYFVTSFTGIGAPERYNGSFFGDKLSQKLNIPFVGIIAKNDMWYLDGDYIGAFNAAFAWKKQRYEALTNEKALHIGYGISMGAYAVTKHSKFFDYDYIIALAPQWSLDKKEVDYYSGFQNYYKDFMSGMGVQPHELCAETFLFYDPHNTVDTLEASCFSKSVRTNLIPVCYGGHMVGYSFKGSRNFLDILNNIGNKSTICSIVSKARKKNKENIYLIIEKTIKDNKKLTLKALFSQRAIQSGAHDQFVLNSKKLWDVARWFAEANLLKEAYLFYYYATGKKQQVIKLPRLLTWRGEILCFCHKDNVFTQTYEHVQVQGNMVTVIGDQLFSVTPSGLIKIDAHIQFTNTILLIFFKDGYVSAGVNESTSIVNYVKRWEQFFLMPYPKGFLGF